MVLRVIVISQARKCAVVANYGGKIGQLRSIDSRKLCRCVKLQNLVCSRSDIKGSSSSESWETRQVGVSNLPSVAAVVVVRRQA